MVHFIDQLLAYHLYIYYWVCVFYQGYGSKNYPQYQWKIIYSVLQARNYLNFALWIFLYNIYF